MKQRLSLAKILKFARDKGFAYNQIYKIRGDARFIVFSLEKDNDSKIVVEIPIHHSVIIKSKSIENVLTLRPTEQNIKHIDYWSFLSPNITENCLFCRSSGGVTIFKDNGEIKSYSLSLGTELEEDSDDENTTSPHNDNEKKEKFASKLEETINDLLKDAKKEETFSSKIVFKDENGKEFPTDNIDEKYIPTITPLENLKEEDLKQEYSDSEDRSASVEENDSSSSEKQLHEEEEKILKEKLGDLYKLESEAELDLGEFYLMTTLTEFYQNFSEIKEKLKKFSLEFLNEEENIRESRLENLLIALSSLNPTIQNFFDSYSTKEKEFKEQLNRLIPLYKKIKDLPENSKKTTAISKRSNTAKEKLEARLPELKNIINIKKKEINYIRDILNEALGKLEQDVEKISSRCTIAEVDEPSSDEEGEEEIEEEQ